MRGRRRAASFRGFRGGNARKAKGRPEVFAVIKYRAKYRASRSCFMASETLRGLEQSLLLQKLREHLEPYLAVVDLEHALLDRERQRQDLGQPIADPGRVGERELGGKVLLADTVDQELEQVGEWLERIGQRERRLGRERSHLPDDQTVFGDRVCLHLKPRHAFGPQMQDAELRHVPGRDPRKRADRSERESRSCRRG